VNGSGASSVRGGDRDFPHSGPDLLNGTGASEGAAPW
jgi:hypothetical protein